MPKSIGYYLVAFVLAAVHPAAAEGPSLREYSLPESFFGAGGITQGPDGAMWFTSLGRIGRITSDGKITEFPTVSSNGRGGITLGPDSALWFTEGVINKQIGRITTDGVVTQFPIQNAADFGPIVAGPDGALWFAEFRQNKIGRITVSGDVSEFAIPSPNSGVRSLVVGPDNAIWFCEDRAHKFGRIAMNGEVTEIDFRDADHHVPLAIALGPDGAFWFTEPQAIGRITTDKAISLYKLPTRAARGDIITGPDRALWVTNWEGNKIERFLTSGSPAGEFPLPTADSKPRNIVAGSDQAVWFTELESKKIGRIGK